MPTKLFLIPVCLLVAMLVGCAEIQTHSIMDANLQSVKGKSIEDAIKLFGIPDSERTVAGRVIYTWDKKEENTISIPSFSTTTSPSGGIYRTSTQENIDASYLCKVEVITQNGVIIDANHQGNMTGCYVYFVRKRGLTLGNSR